MWRLRPIDDGDRLREERGIGREPVKYFVLVTKREKRACNSCEERGVMAAPLPPRIIEKSLVSDQVIVDAFISKYSNHCPRYRQSVILLRDEASTSAAQPWEPMSCPSLAVSSSAPKAFCFAAAPDSQYFPPVAPSRIPCNLTSRVSDDPA
jgi:hypothetical protein